MNEQIESLLEEKRQIVSDLAIFGGNLNAHTHDTLTNRLEMIEFMLSNEGYYA